MELSSTSGGVFITKWSSAPLTHCTKVPLDSSEFNYTDWVRWSRNKIITLSAIISHPMCFSFFISNVWSTQFQRLFWNPKRSWQLIWFGCLDVPMFGCSIWFGSSTFEFGHDITILKVAIFDKNRSYWNWTDTAPLHIVCLTEGSTLNERRISSLIYLFWSPQSRLLKASLFDGVVFSPALT